MAAFLGQNWLAFASLVVSVFAVWLSYVKLRRESWPILHVHASPGTVEIENIGTIAAVDVTATLLEPTERASGRLSVDNVLRAQGGKGNICAWDWPKELEQEIRKHRLISVEDTILRLSGKDPPIPQGIVSQYLICRPGGQLLAIRYRIADNPRTHVRLFRVLHTGEGFPHFVRVRAATRLSVAVLQFLWRNHPQYRPPFKFPSRDKNSDHSNPPGLNAVGS